MNHIAFWGYVSSVEKFTNWDGMKGRCITAGVSTAFATSVCRLATRKAYIGSKYRTSLVRYLARAEIGIKNILARNFGIKQAKWYVSGSDSKKRT